MQWCHKGKRFSSFFFVFVLFWQFQNLDSILSIYEKKMNLIAYVFLNLRIPKDVVR